MPLFHGPSQQGTGFPVPSAGACLRHGCPDAALTDCHYVDRDGNACGTSWCFDHLEVMADEAYCVRHCGIMRALHGTALAGHRPPVGNRAASLVSWVANDMDERIRWAMENVADRDAYEPVVAEPISYDTEHGSERRIWRRTWRLATHDLVPVVVTIEADEDRDYEIGLLVDGDPVAVVTPPWVRRHIERDEASSGEDTTERRSFYVGLSEQLSVALGDIKRRRSS